MNRLLPAILAAALATPGPTADGLSASDVVAKWRAVSGAGKTVRNETSIWNVHEAGLSGTSRRVARGREWAEYDELGSFQTARGYAAGRFWHMNENGEVLLSYLGRTREDLLPLASETVTHVQSPVDAYLVEGTARDGTVRRRYYDSHSFLLVRSESEVYGKHQYAVYEDFATDAAGRTWARHSYGGDQFPRDDWDYRLVSDDLSTPVTEDQVALPHNRRTLVEFPQGVTTVRLPARIVHGVIVVRVQIAGRGVDFLLDSGASSIVIDAALANSLGLETAGHQTELIAGAVDMKRTKIAEMTVGQLKLHDVVVDVVPFEAQVDSQVKVAGLLGFDFLDDASVTIDYDKETVDATAPDAFVPDPGSTDVAVRMPSGVPEISVRIGSTSGDKFILDTGAQQETIALSQRFVRQNESGVSDAAKRGEGTHSRAEMIGGEVDRSSVLLRDLTFGPWHIASIYGTLARPTLGFSFDGLIGSNFLDNFVVTLDEAHGKVYLKPTVALPLESPSPGPAPSAH